MKHTFTFLQSLAKFGATRTLTAVLGTGLLVATCGLPTGFAANTETAKAPAWEAPLRARLEAMAEELTRTLKPWTVPDRSFPVDNYGAAGDGKTLNTEAIQKAVNACSEAGGGVVLFGKGDYVTGTIDLKSGVMLEIAKDSKILGSTNLRDYPDRIAKRRIVMDTWMDIRHSLIYAEGCERVGIRGPGMIDFRGEYKNFPGKITVAKIPGRPFGMRFIDCKKVVVENVQLRNSASWMQNYLNCEELIIQKVNNANLMNGNNDGLDIDGCRRVIVRDCFFNAIDDSMCMKGASLRPMEDVLIENSTFYSACNSFKIGTDTQGSFRRIYARNLVLGHAPQELWKNASKVALAHDPTESGITLATVDGGDVEDIWISQVTIDRVEDPIFLRVGRRSRLMPGMPAAPPGKFRRVLIENVTGASNGTTGSFISGIKDGRVEDVVIRDVNLGVRGGVTKWPAVVPEDETGYPDAMRFNRQKGLPAYGFWIRHARGIHLENIKVTPEKPDTRPLFGTDVDVDEFFVDGRTIAAPPIPTKSTGK